MRKVTVGIAAMALVALSWHAVPGLAAMLNRSSHTLGAGSATISRCDTDGVSTLLNTETTAPFPVVSVTVSGIAAGCAGKTIEITVSNGLLNVSGTGVIAAGGGSMTLILAATIAMSDATQTEVSIT